MYLHNFRIKATIQLLYRRISIIFVPMLSLELLSKRISIIISALMYFNYYVHHLCISITFHLSLELS